jgi:hypothetical protein
MDTIDAVDFSGTLALNAARYAAGIAYVFWNWDVFRRERGPRSINQSWHNAVFHSQIAIAALHLEGREALLSSVTWTNAVWCGLVRRPVMVEPC